MTDMSGVPTIHSIASAHWRARNASPSMCNPIAMPFSRVRATVIAE